MRKKSIISTILFLAIAFIGCQKNNIQQSKNYENKSDVKIVKREKLKKCTKTRTLYFQLTNYGHKKGISMKCLEI